MRILLATLSLSACTTADPDEPRCSGDVYAPGMIATGAAGAAITLMAADPAPPARFINTWTIVATDAAGATLPASAVAVTTFMPEHGHGGRPVTVTAGTDPTLLVTPIDLWMPGRWEVTFAISATGGVDRARFSFCIEE